MPTMLVVLDSRRITRALQVDVLALDRVRREMQAWLDARVWVLDGDLVRELVVQKADEPTSRRPSLRALDWQICGPTTQASPDTRWVLPGEAHLFDERGRWRLPPERVEAMGVRRTLRDATARLRASVGVRAA
jgi:hypothetical protein